MIRKWMEAVWEIWEDRHKWGRVTNDELLYKKTGGNHFSKNYQQFCCFKNCFKV
jgi:hypothetical protein